MFFNIMYCEYFSELIKKTLTSSVSLLIKTTDVKVDFVADEF